jgi:hypothetical protein
VIDRGAVETLHQIADFQRETRLFHAAFCTAKRFRPGESRVQNQGFAWVWRA